MGAKDSNVLYVGMFVDILGRELGINDKKIGITGGGNATIFRRKNQLSNTKSPILWVPLRAWEFSGDTKTIEQTLHNMFEDRRTNGEWFRDDKDTLVHSVESFINLLKNFDQTIIEVDLNISDEDSTARRVRKIVNAEHRKLITDPILDNTKWYFTRHSHKMQVTFLEDGLFKNDVEDTKYDSPNKAAYYASQFWNQEDLGDPEARSSNVNVWTTLRDEEGTTLEEVCKRIYYANKETENDRPI